MMGTTHALSGAAAFLVAAPQVFPDAGPAEIAAGAAIAAGFALLPDVDHPAATITNRLPLGGLVARVVGAVSGGHRQGTHSLLAAGMLAALAFGLPAALPDDRAPYALAVLAYFGAVFGVGTLARAVGNRLRSVTTHGVALVVAAAVATEHLPATTVAVAAVGGYVMHLLGDALTSGGVPFLWPSKRRFGLALLTTGSATETVLRIGLVVGTAGFLWAVHLA